MKKAIAAAIILVVSALLVALPATAGQGKKENSGESSHLPNVPAGPTYVISPGDVLDISVWKEPNISFRGLPVRPDGKISLPLINDVQAAGLTAMQLSSSITQKLKKYIEDPQVTVVVAVVNSQRYYLLGEVARPGVFPLLPGLRVLQALSAAGGFSQFANVKKIYVLRSVNGSQQKFPFNYKDVVAGHNLQENIELKPGDTIIVP
ncbi:MAG: polysaccharide biosynthesis/export family protein [Terriglobia bacterium]